MNIIDAAKAMKEGKTVTRTKMDRERPVPRSYEKFVTKPNTWAEGLYLDEWGTVRTNGDYVLVLFNAEALLADDWEIVDE